MAENERRQHRRVEHFMFKNKDKGFIPVWMYSDRENTLQCLMVNISAGGCSLLVSKQVPQLQGDLHLKIYSSDKGLQEQLTLRAEQRWSDDTYSVDHKHVGLEFTDLSDGTRVKIERLVSAFAEDTKNFLLAELSSVQPTV